MPFRSLAPFIVPPPTIGHNYVADAFRGMRDQERISEQRRATKESERLRQEQLDEQHRAALENERLQGEQLKLQQAQEERISRKQAGEALGTAMENFIAGNTDFASAFGQIHGFDFQGQPSVGQPTEGVAQAPGSEAEKATAAGEGQSVTEMPPSSPDEPLMKPEQVLGIAGYPGYEGFAPPPAGVPPKLPYNEQTRQLPPKSVTLSKPGTLDLPDKVDEAGAMPEAQGQPAATKPERQIYNIVKDGQVIGTFDPTQINEARQDKLRSYLKAMRENDRASMAAAWRGPEGAAAAILDAVGGDPRAAEEVATKLAESARTQISAEYRAGLQSQRGQAASDNVARRAMHDDLMGIAKEVRTSYKVADAHEAMAEIRNVIAGATSDSSMEQRVAIAQTMRALFTARASDQDRKFIEEGTGAIGRMMMRINSWIAGGQVPDKFLAELHRYANVMEEHLAERILEAGKTGAKAAYNAPFMPYANDRERKAAADWVFDMVTGEGTLGANGPVGNAVRRSRERKAPVDKKVQDFLDSADEAL